MCSASANRSSAHCLVAPCAAPRRGAACALTWCSAWRCGAGTWAKPPRSAAHSRGFGFRNAIDQNRPEAEGTMPDLVNPDNFNRAESDMYFAEVVNEGGFGRFEHHREVMPIERQTVVRANRDTLYSAAVFDLDAGAVTVTLP